MQYHLGVNGRQEGPVTESEILKRITAGELKATDLCWTDGWPAWRTLRESFPAPFASPVVVPPPVVGNTAPPAHAPSLRPQSPSQPTCGLAVASMLLGLVGLVASCFTGIPAIICGHMALSQIKRAAGAVGGRGFALTGLVLGYFSSVVMAVGIAAAVAIPAFMQAREASQYRLSETKLNMLVTACLAYNLDNGRLPSSYDDLLQSNMVTMSDVDTMDLPYTEAVETNGYVFVSGPAKSLPGNTIIIYERVRRRDGSIAVGRLDGYVSLLPLGDPELDALDELEWSY